MISNHLDFLTKHFNLGRPSGHIERIYGGLLHRMWQIHTDKGAFVIKQLSNDIDLQNDKVIKNYELSEKIASSFIINKIPAVCALSSRDKYLAIKDKQGYLVYPWINGKVLQKDQINQPQALTIATLVAKMHAINLDIQGIENPDYQIHDSKHIVHLIKLSAQMRLPFANVLNSKLTTLLKINETYMYLIEILKNESVISHGDLDQKNVLWIDKNEPILIDWESARKLNPTYDIVNVALDWASITSNFKTSLFHNMLKSYSEAGGTIKSITLEAAFYGVMGNWINWMVYNIERVINQNDDEQKNIGIEQVNQALQIILSINTLMPKLISEIRV